MSIAERVIGSAQFLKEDLGAAWGTAVAGAQGAPGEGYQHAVVGVTHFRR
jgi:hypothetical protein